MLRCYRCETDYSTDEGFLDHCRIEHNLVLNDAPVSGILASAKVSTVQPLHEQHCPMCLTKGWTSRRDFVSHVGRHMEEIALTSLPPTPGSSLNLDNSSGRSQKETSEEAVTVVHTLPPPLPPPPVLTGSALPHESPAHAASPQRFGQQFASYQAPQQHPSRISQAETAVASPLGEVLPPKIKRWRSKFTNRLHRVHSSTKKGKDESLRGSSEIENVRKRYEVVGARFEAPETSAFSQNQKQTDNSKDDDDKEKAEHKERVSHVLFRLGYTEKQINGMIDSLARKEQEEKVKAGHKEKLSQHLLEIGYTEDQVDAMVSSLKESSYGEDEKSKAEYKRKLQEDLTKFGFTPKQIDAMIDNQSHKKEDKEKALTIPLRPVVTKVWRGDILDESLDYWALVWENDFVSYHFILTFCIIFELVIINFRSTLAILLSATTLARPRLRLFGIIVQGYGEESSY